MRSMPRTARQARTPRFRRWFAGHRHSIIEEPEDPIEAMIVALSEPVPNVQWEHLVQAATRHSMTFTRGTWAEGTGRMLDWSGSLNSYRWLFKEDADADALARDWWCIGFDAWAAFSLYSSGLASLQPEGLSNQDEAVSTCRLVPSDFFGDDKGWW